MNVLVNMMTNTDGILSTEKANEFNFLNEEVEEFTSKWSQNLVNASSPSYLKQKIFKLGLAHEILEKAIFLKNLNRKIFEEI